MQITTTMITPISMTIRKTIESKKWRSGDCVPCFQECKMVCKAVRWFLKTLKIESWDLAKRQGTLPACMRFNPQHHTQKN